MNKTAVVTGAGQGLGLCFVKECLKRGYNVIALEFKDTSALEGMDSDKLKIFRCDITDLKQLADIKGKIGEIKLDLLINNAGVWLEKGRKKLEDEDFSFDNILPQFETNAMGMLKVCKTFMPNVLESDLKTVINISSEAGSIKNAFRVSEYGYCMSKAALNVASKIMQNAYEKRGVKVYCFHPGWMQTSQGMAGAEGENKPNQSPQITAAVILNIAEGERLPEMFYKINGKDISPYEW